MRPTAILAALIGTTILAAAVVYPAFARGAGGQAFSPNNGQYSSYATPRGLSNIGNRERWDNGGTPPGWKRGKKVGWHGAKTPPGLGRSRHGSHAEENDD
jgi:hypothetical protein